MWTDRPARRSEQPELPLSAPPVRHDERTFEWQLDEATCRIGRRGVAEARALLVEATARVSGTGDPPETSEDGAEAA